MKRKSKDSVHFKRPKEESQFAAWYVKQDKDVFGAQYEGVCLTLDGVSTVIDKQGEEYKVLTGTGYIEYCANMKEVQKLYDCLGAILKKQKKVKGASK